MNFLKMDTQPDRSGHVSCGLEVEFGAPSETAVEEGEILETDCEQNRRSPP